MKMDEHDRFPERSIAGPKKSASLAEFEAAQYLPYLNGLDLEETQKHEFLLILWDIMRMWVEMDLPLVSCGQIVEGLISAGHDDSGDVQ